MEKKANDTQKRGERIWKRVLNGRLEKKRGGLARVVTSHKWMKEVSWPNFRTENGSHF